MTAKIPIIAPDAAVLDLEDAISPEFKPAARRAAAGAIRDLDGGTVAILIRINPAGSAWFEEDLAAVRDLQGIGVVLPKYERTSDVELVRDWIGYDVPVVVGIESVGGVRDCQDLLHAAVDAAYFGAEDYIADVGGFRTPGGQEVLYARSSVIVAARTAGVAAIDQAVVAVHDGARFLEDSAIGRSIGYSGKLCVHPKQVPLAHQVFTPSDAEVMHARAVLAHAEGGVGILGEEMVDGVHVRAAQAVLARAEASRPAGETAS
jgi:citrate lyase subunit beta/citryl-CoA lyase